MGQQLALLLGGDKQQTLVRAVSPGQCSISRFNTRKARDDEAVTKLAQRMVMNGFEMTRALWVYAGEGGQYEVFAGGTRLEAARRAGVSVDVILHEGYSWEDISRLSDQDNENDEYHQPVRPMDVWAEYARLRDEEGWTQQQIAETKGVSQPRVSARLQYHDDLPDSIRALVGISDGHLSEGHIEAVFGKYQTADSLTSWVNIPSWRIADLETAIQKKWSTRQLADQWQRRKDAVTRANGLVDALPDGVGDEYVASESGEIVRAECDWRQAFAVALADMKAATAAQVDQAFAVVAKRQERSAQRKADFDAKLSAEEQRAQEEKRQIEYIGARWLCGDSVAHLPALADGGVRLVLTDPPYGVGFQSNRRVASGKLDALENDASRIAALSTFGAMLDAVAPKLADEAHLLVFAHWKTEFDFRAELEKRGYVIRGSLVWVRENHGSGDLDGSFAPKHERIIHATKGRPAVSPRIDDVFVFARGRETEHPTEKPVELLKVLINSTTARGDLVIDPFGGVASTLVAAIQTGRAWWGCELAEGHWNDGYKRINDVTRNRVQEKLELATDVSTGSRARAA